MLQIIVPAGEFFNQRTQMFSYTTEQRLQLEHSLVSISKWEAKWHKPFLDGHEKNTAEFRDYVRCMTLTQNVDPKVYFNLTNENLRQIKAYMDDPMTATKVPQKNGPGGSREPITSELIYYWMAACQLPPEYQKWHINRLMTLIKLCNAKNAQAMPDKKKKPHELYSQYKAINEANKRRFSSAG